MCIELYGTAHILTFFFIFIKINYVVYMITYTDIYIYSINTHQKYPDNTEKKTCETTEHCILSDYM